MVLFAKLAFAATLTLKALVTRMGFLIQHQAATSGADAHLGSDRKGIEQNAKADLKPHQPTTTCASAARLQAKGHPMALPAQPKQQQVILCLRPLRLLLLSALGWQGLSLGLTSAEQTAVTLREDQASAGVVSLGPDLPVAYFAPRSLPYRHSETLDERWLQQSMEQMQALGLQANRFVFFAQDEKASALLLVLAGLSCDSAERIVGTSAVARLLAMGDSANKKSGPLMMYRCSGSDLAAGPPMIRPQPRALHLPNHDGAGSSA